jgi:MFS family permease
MTFFAILMDIFTKTFYYPTFTSHLMSKFGLSIETSTLFFIIHIFSYLIVLSYINKITTRFGLKLTITVGLFFNFIGALFISPIGLLPQSYFTIIIGLLILGIPGALISVPGICDLIEILQSKLKRSEDSVANDVASAIYNLAVNLGEALGPSIGGHISKVKNFETSCICSSLINFFLGISFLWYNFNSIKYQLNGEENKNDLQINLIDKKLNRKMSHESFIIGIINRSYSRSRIHSYDLHNSSKKI